MDRAELPAFFERHRDDFNPLAVYRAKIRGRFEKEFQLSFVDVGLISMVEGQLGKALSRLVERLATEIKHALGDADLMERTEKWLFQSVFWMLAAKILQDKQVPAFVELDLTNVSDVFSTVAKHYGTDPFSGWNDPKKTRALTGAARSVARFSNLRNVTSESLAYLYENALISKETRKNFATHSTPGYLVDYMVWRLAPWIEKVPLADRDVLEPGCGHSAFLVAALRVLRDFLPSSMAVAAGREYLCEHLHGVDLDSFALEIARLSLTLADIPNSDGWDLRRRDMFQDNAFTAQLQRATVVLANPPFGHFLDYEEQALRNGDPDLCDEKATDLLRRIVRDLRPGAVFGIVLPQSILARKGATALRRQLVQECQILEILLFPDKVFTFSDIETAILLGRKPATGEDMANQLVAYKQVRKADIARFRLSSSVTSCREVSQRRFAVHPEARLLLPELEEVWLWCRHLPVLGDIAKVSKGFDYKRSSESVAEQQFPDAVKGFSKIARPKAPVMLHQLPSERWMSLAPDAIQAARSGTTTGVSQVLVPYARVSRGPWRLKAFIDERGHPVTSAFLTVRPLSRQHSVLFLWAVCNSPVANAFVYCETMTRHVLTSILSRVPLPVVTKAQVERVEDAARAYRSLMREPEQPMFAPPPDEDEARRLLLQVDAEVLRLYGFPPRLERQLLDLFLGRQRPGVPFTFDRYFPDDFEPCFPLHLYLSESYDRSTSGHLAERHSNLTSPLLLEALREAVDAFEE